MTIKNQSSSVSVEKTASICLRKVLLKLPPVLGFIFIITIVNFSANAQLSFNFDSPTFTTGTIHNQNGWSSLGTAGMGCGVYDHYVQNNSALTPSPPASFGSQSLRISNATATGCFSDYTFTASLPNEAGETSAVSNGNSGGTRKKKFAAQWQFISVTPNAEQPGLALTVSPDRGDGARMSWIQMADTPNGININFNDYQRSVNDFVFTTVATGLSRTVPHTIRVEMDFIDGPANDIVRIYIDGVLRHTGTSWEDYFRDQEGNPTRTVDSLLFRQGGAAAPATNGKGFLIDNLTLASPSVLVVDDDGTASETDCGAATSANMTIQAAVNTAAVGDIIKVCPGTYPETVNTNKSLTFLGPQAGVDARTGRTNPSNEAVVGVSGGAFNLQLLGGTTFIDGFTLANANTSNGDGAALALYNSAGHQIVNNIFTGNQRGAFFSSNDTTFKHNRINNTFDGFFGGGDNATFEENAFTGAYPDGAINTTHQPQSNNYKIINNTFNATGNFAVVFNTNNGQVSGNTVTGTSSTAIFIGGGNNNLLVSNNTITGNGGSAVGLSGGFNYLPDTNISIISNKLNSNARGVRIAAAASTTTGVEIHFNQIVGNTEYGVVNETATLINAENNWWGCNYGPGAAGAGCSGTTNAVSTNVDANPWLVLTSSASPSAILTGGTSNITSRLTFNSNNVDTSSLGTVPNGIPAAFSATLGSVSPTNNTTTAGVTITTFTAGASAGTGSVSTTINGQTVSTPITITFPCNNVSIPTGASVPSNTQFLVPVNVDSTTGRGIFSYDFTLTYNPAVVSPIGVETTGTLSNGWTITTNSSSGTIVISGFSVSPLTGSGTLLNIRFISIGSIGSTSNLNLPSFVFNEGSPCVNTSNGNVTVISGSISGQVTYANTVTTVPVPNVTLNAAGSIPVSSTTNGMGIYSLSGLGTGSYTVTPSKTGQANGISNSDATSVAQHVVGFTTLNSTQQIAADVSGNGTITSLDASYIAQYVAGFPNPSITGTWKFNPVNRSYPNVQTNYTGQDYSAILMGEVTGNWNPSLPLVGNLSKQDKGDTKNGDEEFLQPEQIVTVSAPALQTVSNGENFVVDLTASNTTGENIFGYEFNLIYDSNVIYPQVATPCTSTGTLSNGRSVVCNPNTPGLLRVVVFSTTGTPISGAGTLLKLNFTAIGSGGQASPLTFQNFMFNEGIPQDVTQNGSIFILDPTAAGASLSGRVLSPTGTGVSNSRVTIADSNGETRTALTNSLGYYQFDDLTAGQTYFVNVSSKKYTFRTQAVSIFDNITDFNIIAEH